MWTMFPSRLELLMLSLPVVFFLSSLLLQPNKEPYTRKKPGPLIKCSVSGPLGVHQPPGDLCVVMGVMGSEGPQSLSHTKPTAYIAQETKLFQLLYSREMRLLRVFCPWPLHIDEVWEFGVSSTDYHNGDA